MSKKYGDGEQPRVEDGFTIVKCVHCGKLFKFLNADPEFTETICFCSEACRNVHFWLFGKARFLEIMKAK